MFHKVKDTSRIRYPPGKGVPRAKWEICSDGYYPYCTRCKQEPPGRVMTDYCPHCGAFMSASVK